METRDNTAHITDLALVNNDADNDNDDVETNEERTLTLLHS